MEEPVQYGVGIRLREVFVPQGVLNLFLNHAAGGAQNTGIGGELIRRRGNTELTLGFEYEHVQPAEGIYINSGVTDLQDNEVDYFLSPSESGKNFGWFTIDFNFLHHAEINKYVAFRYGAGLGIGIITGEIDIYRETCAAGATVSSPAPGCNPSDSFGSHQGQSGGAMPFQGSTWQAVKKDGIPPVFPVLDLIVGFQFRPFDKMTINIEGGIRTLPFVGVSAAYFF